MSIGEYEDGDESDGEPNKKRVSSISTAVMNMEVEQEPTVLQIKGFLNSTFSSMILIDYGSTRNMMSVLFAHEIGIPLIPSKPCSVWLPNNQPSFITYRVLRIHVNIQEVNTEADFEVWDEVRYEVIPGMAWPYGGSMHAREVQFDEVFCSFIQCSANWIPDTR